MTKIHQVFLICALLSIVSFEVFSSSFQQRTKRRAGWTSLQKIVCVPNSLYINATCTLKPISRIKKNITLAFTLLKPHSNLQVQMKQWQKMNSNRYMPGFVDITFNVCDLVKDVTNHNNVLRLYLDNYNSALLKKIKHFIHPCPYVGLHLLLLSHEDIQVDRYRWNLWPPADYRFDLRLFTKEYDIGTLQIFESTK